MNTKKQNEMEAQRILARFLDENGRITAYPAKNRAKHLVLSYLAEKFNNRTHYTEKEVNDVISLWHTFGDFFLLRRELIDNEFLARTSSGSKYWKVFD
jgi:hypothetical protein